MRLAGISGIAGAVLFGVGSAIWGLDMPEDGTPIAEVVDWYQDVADRIVIGGSLSLLAVAAFLFFAAAFRRVLADAEGNDVLATAAFGGFLLSMTAGIAAEGINLAAALTNAAQTAFIDAIHVVAVVATIGAVVTAIGTAVALRSVPARQEPASEETPAEPLGATD